MLCEDAIAMANTHQIRFLHPTPLCSEKSEFHVLLQLSYPCC